MLHGKVVLEEIFTGEDHTYMYGHGTHILSEGVVGGSRGREEESEAKMRRR